MMYDRPLIPRPEIHPVRSPRQPLPVCLAAAAALIALAVACGGGGSSQGGPSVEGAIPTATAPAELPDPIIVGSSEQEIEGETYTVQDGDTLSSIAAQYGITSDELMAANGITDPTSLFIGQVLRIPGQAPSVLGETEPAATPVEPVPTEPPPPAEPEGQVYIVQEGDIPETIAAQYGITADQLMAANGITDPTSLFIGQELVIPTAE
jgi:LysM repeat protein